MNPLEVVNETTIQELNEKMETLQKRREEAMKKSAQLNELHLQLEARNEQIEAQLQRESEDFDLKLDQHQKLLEKTKAECKEAIQVVEKELEEDFKAANQIKIENSKRMHHLKFTLNEKKEVEETRKSMLAQEAKLKQQLKETMREMKEKVDTFVHESYAAREAYREEAARRLQEQITEAKAAIEKERIDTLKEAERESQVLTKQVGKVQKAVVALGDQYNQLLKEANDLEMKQMDAKLVTQLTHPEAKRQKIHELYQQKAQLDDQRLKSRAQTEAENRRTATHHQNLMNKKKNELSGYVRLNQLKAGELKQLRDLASTIIEQRNTLLAYMNETLTQLRKAVASNVDQKTLAFRTSELVLCHIDTDEQSEFSEVMNDSEGLVDNPKEQLRFYEILYSRFTGAPQPRKLDDVV